MYFNSDHMIDFCVIKVFMVKLETNSAWLIKFLKFMKCPWVWNNMLEPNEQHFILLLETNNTFRVMTQTYFHSDHYIHGIVANKQCFSDKDFSTI